MAPPGLWPWAPRVLSGRPLALGAKGSVRDRLTPPGRVEGSALGSYIVSLPLGRWAPVGAISYAAFGGENRTTALRARKCIPPFGGLRHHLPPAERWDYGCLAMEP